MSQTNVREGYRITTLEVVELVEDLISYLLKSLRSPTLKDWLAVAKCIRLRNAQIPKVFYEAAAGTIWTMMLAKVRQYGAKVKTEDLSNTLTLTLSETAQRQSLSVVSNRSTASITDKFSVALLTEPAILNNANVALVDAMHYFVQKLEENYFEVRAQHLKYDVMDALTMTLIKDDDDLLGTVNSYIKSRRLRARRKTKAADSRHAKASGGRTKKDKDSEDSDTSSDVPRLRRRDRAAARAQLAERKRLGKEAQLKKTRDEEKLAKAKKEKEEKELTDAYILYFKELSSNNGGIFANAIGMSKTRAIVLAVLMRHLCPTKGERTFYCACERSPSFNAEPRQAAIMMTSWGRAADAWKNEVVAMDLTNSTWCDLSDPLALRFCFFSDSPLENIGRLTKEEAMEMQIDTTNAISKALAAANKLVASRSYTIPEANTPAVHSKATKHCPALLAAQFVIVCGFRKVDKHMFRAYNTISVTAQRTIIRKGGPYIEKRAILLPTLNSLAMAKQWRNIIANVKHDASEHESSHEFMLKRTLKTRDLWGKLISGIKSDFLPYFQSCLCLDFLSTVQNAEQQCRDILEKEGLNESEASRRVIFNCFEIQAIASYSALATLKAAQFKTYSSRKVKRFTLNSVKDLFTNSSKDHFLVREARAITKSSLNIAAEDTAKAANTLLLLKEVRAKILIGSYKPIKFGDESVLVMQGGMTQHEINLKLAKWRDPDRPWIIVASMAFAEAITLTEATHVLAEMCVGIVYFNLDSKLELKVLGGGSTVTDQRIDWHQTELIVISLEALC
ncbi:hypothetical protein HBH50_153480 [Parastagonospora nodorum]|nr:hypothetical protein HBH50_153480 [Parastagonospora nodorum]KAH4079546.1 hypothetical protein HBH48_220270 [Parastagonospora nodorum]